MKYRVEITRASYSTKTFEVEAENQEQAQQLALDDAYNTVFDEDYADYSIENVRDV